MKITQLLSEEVQEYIQSNANIDPKEVALRAHGKFNFSVGFLVDQISGRKKAKKKLPSWFAHPLVLFPPDISMQQCSSEQAAVFKASLFPADSVIDLTGGFGIDSVAFSTKSKSVIHVERDKWLSEIVEHNMQAMNLSGVSCINDDATRFLNTYREKVDLIYVDPARRNESGGKVFKFADCEPNVVDLNSLLFERAANVLIKASPMVDITQGIRELRNVSKVWVVSIKNECKEVLFLLENERVQEIEISIVSLGETDKVLRAVKNQQDFLYTEPKKFLYDPNVGLHKVGSYANYLAEFSLTKIAANTHLFTSDELEPLFPGRVFKIMHVIPYNKKAFRECCLSKKMNVFVRNFPDSPEKVKRKLGIHDGGSKMYAIGCRSAEGKPILLVVELVNGWD